ncbi:MAG: hypothetical protein AVDCRST_MAG59-4391 [uncultured Thermomicrobiales bacterium]|uniref:Uncharacterized protein n=1 Tax=uncultured Thermomicrobiales bacterium TaxID=1645740 RepID=A0A6J4VHX8_9BACT|nr:MAG: hypothetical protein AVDCRST_MAG59-4391 [uncultured Thermomicrobiales bacterium]
MERPRIPVRLGPLILGPLRRFNPSLDADLRRTEWGMPHKPE